MRRKKKKGRIYARIIFKTLNFKHCNSIHIIVIIKIMK